MNLTIKKVDFKYFKQNLEKHYLNDFPEDERCYVRELKKMYAKDKIEILCLFKEEVLYGYALILLDEKRYNCMLWYFAIIKKYRNKGFGTTFVNMLKDELAYYENVILEVERRKFGINEEENNLREKRLEFYKKLNLEISGLKVCAYGVHFEIILFNKYNEDEEKLFNIYKEIYYNIRSKRVVDKKIVKVL